MINHQLSTECTYCMTFSRCTHAFSEIWKNCGPMNFKLFILFKCLVSVSRCLNLIVL